MQVGNEKCAHNFQNEKLIFLRSLHIAHFLYLLLLLLLCTNCKGVKNDTNFGQITGRQEKLDTTCK